MLSYKDSSCPLINTLWEGKKQGKTIDPAFWKDLPLSTEAKEDLKTIEIVMPLIISQFGKNWDIHWKMDTTSEAITKLCIILYYGDLTITTNIRGVSMPLNGIGILIGFSNGNLMDFSVFRTKKTVTEFLAHYLHSHCSATAAFLNPAPFCIGSSDLLNLFCDFNREQENFLTTFEAILLLIKEALETESDDSNPYLNIERLHKRIKDKFGITTYQQQKKLFDKVLASPESIDFNVTYNQEKVVEPFSIVNDEVFRNSLQKLWEEGRMSRSISFQGIGEYEVDIEQLIRTIENFVPECTYIQGVKYETEIIGDYNITELNSLLSKSFYTEVSSLLETFVNEKFKAVLYKKYQHPIHS